MASGELPATGLAAMRIGVEFGQQRDSGSQMHELRDAKEASGGFQCLTGRARGYARPGEEPHAGEVAAAHEERRIDLLPSLHPRIISR